MPKYILTFFFHNFYSIVIGTSSSEKYFEFLQHEDGYVGAYLSTRPALAYYNKMNYKANDVILSSDILFVSPLSIYFRKHSCLLAPANTVMYELTSNGLIRSWVSKYVEDKFLHIKTTKASTYSGFKPLKMNQLRGCFLFCIFLIFVAFIIFILEMVSKYKTKIKIFLDFLNN